ncbi:MAG: ketoacyl-ACP synthase III [Candidatus Nanopelagicales bacterium]|nr:ketoacyl-ACP synthase III [Candidatus Nanopelagicales bacterium]
MTAQITPPRGPEFARILSVGSYRPARIVTNAEICTRIDSTDEWIRERSGIVERRYAADDESVIDMAVWAAEDAIAKAGIDPADIGLVMLASITYPYLSPAAAPQIAVRIGATGAAAVDISSACAGFCYGISMASDSVRGGNTKLAVVIGADRLTDWFDHHDRTLAFLFADGAGAAVIGPSDVPAIGPTIWGSDGTQIDALGIGPSFIDQRNDPVANVPMLYMQGQSVFRWAVGEMARVAQQALDAAGITADQLDAFIPHQANNRITDALIRALKLPDHVPVARDIVTMGNTSAASIPLAMSGMLDDGELPSGGTALIIGFGAGLAYAAQVITLP